MIYWRGINIGDRWVYAEITNIKSAILFQSENAQWHVAQNYQYKICQLTFLDKFTLAKKSSCTVYDQLHQPIKSLCLKYAKNLRS